MRKLWWDLTTEELIVYLETSRRYMSQFSAKEQRQMLEDAGRAMATGIVEGINNAIQDEGHRT